MTEVPLDLTCRHMHVDDALQHWARETPDSPALTFLTFSGPDRVERTLSYRTLDREVSAMATNIGMACDSGHRVALLMSQGIDYVVSFLGALRARRIAIPLLPIDGRSAYRVQGALQDCQPSVAVLDQGSNLSHELLGGLRVLIRDSTNLDLAQITPESIDGAAVAYLQYTSGSTRAPAGIMVTHHNLAVGSSQLRAAIEINPGDVIVTWLPYFHDMGLVYGIGAAIQGGAHAVHMAPMSFVQRPVRWLRAVSDFKARSTVVPNFALDHATSRIRDDELEGLDLSGLRFLGNGSEPVQAASLEAFSKRYAPYGFRPNVHSPGYGLAETTLTVTAVPPREPASILRVDRAALRERRVVSATATATDPDPARLVSSGVPIAQQVIVVDPDTTHVLPSGGVGEVWVQGENVCAGYFGRPELSSEVFSAVTNLPGTWLRTGDLGCLVEGQLYVVGRTKDLIIVGGRNHYPADVEGTVQETLDFVRPNGVAAFAHHDDELSEHAVMVVEIEPRHARTLDLQRIRREVRALVSTRHELALKDIVLAAPGSIPKTTSGKIQRRACATKYGRGEIREGVPVS